MQLNLKKDAEVARSLQASQLSSNSNSVPHIPLDKPSFANKLKRSVKESRNRELTAAIGGNQSQKDENEVPRAG